jgi:hypothetical protein
VTRMPHPFILAAIAIVALAGCATPRVERPPITGMKADRCCRSASPPPIGTAIARTATRLIGARTIQSDGRRIGYDCAGVTRAIYLQHGIDLYHGDAHDPDFNGVRLIHAHVRQHGRLHRGPVVNPGDLVFFDNTWDRNGDGIANDSLTHVGIVERVERDGTVVFISRVAEAVQRYRMNLAQPHVHKTADGRVVNDYMRRKAGASDGIGHLTGELFALFGTRIGS